MRTKSPWPDMPDFLRDCFNWKKKGYTFNSTGAVELLDDSALVHADPWIVVAGVLERAKRGHFEELWRLRGYAEDQHVDPWLNGAAWDLLCDAGGGEDLEFLAGLLISDDFPAFMQVEGCFALVSAGELWLVEYMLECWERMARRADRRSIEAFISRLLEPDEENLELLYGDYSTVEYRALVTGRYNQLLREVGSGEVAVLDGAPVDVPTIVWRMRRYIEECDHGNMWTLRHKFEAYTGVDCSAFFDERQSLNVDEVLRVLDEFEATRPSAAARFEPGRRYFFGHPVPR